MSSKDTNFDVAIIGGGPAGSSMASYLARAGVSCAVFERELFPRPHVGESLVPSSTRVFRELGFLEQMEEHRFPRKFGAVWTAAEGARAYSHDWEGLAADCHAAIRFEEREQAGVDQNYTYHVDRGKFDLLLLQHASRLGASVHEGLAITNVDLSDSSRPRLRFNLGRKSSSVTARLVIDASGRRTLLGNRLKLKVMDPVFDQFAIHSWFESFDRGASDQADYIHVHFLPISNSWIWQIPITDSITSLGVVTQKRNFAKSRASREDFFWECVASRPELLARLEASRQMRAFTSEGDYSYAMREICGDGFLLIGDAARFVDPIFSTGVSIALNSARLAHGDVIRALESGDTAKASFANYEATIQRGIKNWYDFISVYYRLNVLFTAFITDGRYRLDVLKLLQGDVYDEEQPPVLLKMREIVSEVERNPKHPWHKLLGDLTSHAFASLA